MAKSKKKGLDLFVKEKIFAGIRLSKADRVPELLDALYGAGIRIFEITLTTPSAHTIIHDAVKAMPDAVIGAGTVIGYDASVRAIESGAKFLLSPVTDLDMLAVANEMGIPSFAGALTPTEAWQATEAGADFVKVFPLAGIGPDYIRAMRGPLPDIKFVATNGVTPDNINEYFNAGCVAVGLGSSLVSDADMQGSFDAVIARAQTALKQIKTS